MLPATHRLKNDVDVLRVVRSRKSVFDPWCGVKYQENHLLVSRFAFIVSTKVHKRAVVRNRLRRQYREVIRRHLHELLPGYDIILLVGKGAVDEHFQEKERRLLHVLRKARLFRSHSFLSKYPVV